MCLKITQRAPTPLVLAVVAVMLTIPAVVRAQSGHGEHSGHAGHGAPSAPAATNPATNAPAAGRGDDAAVGAADASMSSSHADHDHGGMNDALHMELSPVRAATHDDSARAERLVAELRSAIAKYRDTTAAVADGYRMFAPELKNQRVYHFTNYGRAFEAAFTFDPAKPTSLLYRKGEDGRFELLGAMYTAPKRMSVERLDERVPLSIARWHKHVNWCVPPSGQRERWLEQRDGQPVFGPQSPIATREACDAVGGRFLPSIFGWMVHANVFESDPAKIWAH
jgi:hypothetical protein